MENFKSTEKQYEKILESLKKLDKNKRFKLLEVGAGDRILKKFLNSNLDYDSLDFGDSHDFNFNLDEGKFPIKNDIYDIIICTETLEHVMYPKGVIEEIIRVAKKDAKFYFSLPNEYNFMMRLYYLIGKKTLIDEPFETVSKHLHIHKPRVKDIINLFSSSFKIEKIDYIWQSRKSVDSKFMKYFDKIINFLAQVYPNLFSRMVLVECKYKKKIFKIFKKIKN